MGYGVIESQFPHVKAALGGDVAAVAERLQGQNKGGLSAATEGDGTPIWLRLLNMVNPFFSVGTKENRQFVALTSDKLVYLQFGNEDNALWNKVEHPLSDISQVRTKENTKFGSTTVQFSQGGADHSYEILSYPFDSYTYEDAEKNDCKNMSDAILQRLSSAT